ncbi:LIM and calponin homology domains-containing protein 1 isoform X16 [Hemicordylus capensis]|uniref:LIM and calponin homology domains-containing protein 1 isoform X16 n=1 Tax=Hemicordylus capensis TaxID=884348 RepID=UPI00230480B4|nr:LIM and calponin homology domains-containing protein 1 isoform X16 [Hemicordylus capensis]
MASPGLELVEGPAQPLQDSPQPEPAFAEAQKWIEQVTGRNFGGKDFRSGLENGVLLCELLNSIKPGLVKKINRLPTPIAGLDNIALFLRGCKELGLKESQLFDPGDLQDTSSRATVKNPDCSRKLKNILVTIYWLGKTANSSTYYSGATLKLKEFEGLLTQMRKETEDVESPKRSIRDSGYVDCWDSERSDSLSPPRHGRDDSFDSLDSFGSRSQQTPSPDVVLRGSSDGRGSDSESDLPHRKLPDVKKDDMSARRTSYGEPKSVVPFNQYLPNKSNQTAYIPAPLRKKRAEREEFRKSWSTATSPIGGERPFSKSHPETIEEEQSEAPMQSEVDPLALGVSAAKPSVKPVEMDTSQKDPLHQSPTFSAKKPAGLGNNEKNPKELRKLRRLEQAGIKVMPATQRYGSRSAPHCGVYTACVTFLTFAGLCFMSLPVTHHKHMGEMSEPSPDIILRKENPFMQKDSGSEDERENRIPDLEKDDFAVRRAKLNQPKLTLPFNQYLLGSYTNNDRRKMEEGSKRRKKQECTSVIMTDTVVSEKRPKLCAEIPQRLTVQPEHEEEQDIPETLYSMQEYVSSDAHENMAHPEAIQPSNSSKMQEVMERNGRECTSLEDEHIQIFGSRTPVSDDAESMSMFDMRCTDETAVIQPHSKARHEKLQTIHHQLKEDEDRWQDDLARWKSRRRSASQDLLKKEAERKKMERLLTGADGTSERRKSIKTYREIVEEKERREKELHEAYKNARSREEAESILQQYIERFTISEAVLERLEMPKILERSHSAEPNSSSPPKDPNPLRYLRQQSLPVPKYTAKVEATIAPASGSEASISTGRTSPSKPFVSKAVPMLTPKPYSQPKNTQQVLKTFKVDGKISMNGETFNGVEEEQDRECTTFIFAPSPSRSPKPDTVVEVDGTLVEGKQDSTSTELVLKRLIEHSKHREQTGSVTEETKNTNQKDNIDSERASPDHKEFSTMVSCASPTVVSVEFPSLTNHSKEIGSNDEPKKPETGQQKDAEAPVMQKAVTLETPEQDGGIAFPFLKKIPEANQVVLQNSVPQADSENSDKSNRFGCWSWDPEEERKRQERWQHEQERLLQERYQKEQDKLKEEWEKAQKEVEEEERRYYEEERKIIEDTVVPFTVTSSSAEPLSTSSSVTDGNGTVNAIDMSNSEEEEKQKEGRTLKKLFCEQDGASFLKNKEYEQWKENVSAVNKVAYLETSNQRGNEQDQQTSTPECMSSTGMTLPLCQEMLQNQQLLTKQSPHAPDTRQKNLPLEDHLGLPIKSTREHRRAGCQENFRTGPPSPCSPTIPSQSLNRYKRSISGKKLCSSCGHPLGKGAAMIIETLGLYFHIQCFRCGICKGQLGDAASGTDVRIRNGLLNCNDCYIRSRTAGQPTTL